MIVNNSASIKIPCREKLILGLWAAVVVGPIVTGVVLLVKGNTHQGWPLVASGVCNIVFFPFLLKAGVLFWSIVLAFGMPVLALTFAALGYEVWAGVCGVGTVLIWGVITLTTSSSE
jgi:hypothetical protein